MLKEIFRENRGRILFSYVMLVMEHGVFSMYPWLFGLAVDGLMANDYSKFRTYMIMMSAGIMIGTFRRVLDTRVFTNLWKRVSSRLVVRLMRKGVAPETTMACAGCSARYVDFMEWHLPVGAQSVIHTVVALVMLWTSVPGPGIWIALVAVAVLATSEFTAKRQASYQRAVIDAQESSTRAINEGDEDTLVKSHDDRAHAFVKKSDWEAAGWCVNDALSMVAEAVIVLALVKSQASIGLVLASVNYCGKLFNNMNGIAAVMAAVKNLQVAGDKIREVDEQ